MKLFKKIKGYPYTKPFRSQNNLRKNTKDLSCVNDPRNKKATYRKNTKAYQGLKGEIAVMKKCEELGFDFQPSCSADIDQVINSFRVEVKSVYTPLQTSENQKCYYYYANVSDKQLDGSDFIVVWIEKYGDAFIIPTITIKCNGVYIRCDYKNEPHSNYKYKWTEYLNAWELLKPRHPRLSSITEN